MRTSSSANRNTEHRQGSRPRALAPGRTGEAHLLRCSARFSPCHDRWHLIQSLPSASAPGLKPSVSRSPI